MQKLTKFKVIFDLFTVCVYFIQQQNCKLYYIYLMIISEIQSQIGHCSCDSAKFKAPADFSHHAILCMTLSLIVSLGSVFSCNHPSSILLKKNKGENTLSCAFVLWPREYIKLCINILSTYLFSAFTLYPY